jgi:hypothetical protein
MEGTVENDSVLLRSKGQSPEDEMTIALRPGSNPSMVGVEYERTGKVLKATAFRAGSP